MTATWTPPPVGRQVETALKAFLSAAALHLGDALPDGSRLPAPDPEEAWRALLCAVALADALGPVMPPALHATYDPALEALLARFAAAHGTRELPPPGLATGAFKDLARLGWPDLGA